MSMFRAHGFIRCSTRPLDVFFHKSDICKGAEEAMEEASVIKDGEIMPGLHVKFICHEEEGKRAVARQICKAEEGSMSLETICEIQFVGQVMSAPSYHHDQDLGYIRYIPDHSKVQHLPFFPSDIITGSTSQLLGAIVLFRICTDKRKEMMAEKGGASDLQRHHASKRAVQIVILGIDQGGEASALDYLEPSMRANIGVLKMMGAAFPFKPGSSS